MSISNEAQHEGQAFSIRIDERVRHGHIPDLRRVQPCDWFYNNPWRRPYLVEMDCGRAFAFALGHARKGHLLDIGCGPGHMSLEFARYGFSVTGLDLSSHSLDVARKLLAENPFRDRFGSLTYVIDDFLSWEVPESSFETVCFFGSLHHFENPGLVLDKVYKLLRPAGRVLVHEPARDWIGDKNGAVVALVRLLLAKQGMWYERIPLPRTEAELRDYIRDCCAELREGKDKTENKQSPHDNDCAAELMLKSLRARFQERECLKLNGIMQRVMGGVRDTSEEETRRLAEFLDVFDRIAVGIGLINPGEFYWAGEKAS